MIDQAQGTIFSFQQNVPQYVDDSDDENAGQPGSFVQGNSRTSCVLQRITAGGALLRTASSVQLGERLNLELTRGHSIDGTVAWQIGSKVGVSFDSRLDVVGSIARDLVNQPDERRRVPRVELRCTACVQSGGATEFATTRDISQGGVKIETSFQLEVGETVEITLDGLPPLTGEVRWRKGTLVGLQFVSELGWQILMPWMKSMSRTADRLASRESRTEMSASSSMSGPSGWNAAGEDTPHVSIPARVREGTRRWNIVVTAIDENQVGFSTLAAIGLDTLVWLILPELEGWPARIVRIEQDRYVGAFAHPLRPSVLERIRASSGLRR